MQIDKRDEIMSYLAILKLLCVIWAHYSLVQFIALL